MAGLIEDYALIGNCRGAALISKTGTLDWLCLPRFDSAACCAALLGETAWQPARPAAVRAIASAKVDRDICLEYALSERDVRRGDGGQGRN